VVGHPGTWYLALETSLPAPSFHLIPVTCSLAVLLPFITASDRAEVRRR
jgi:hypothetical protein